MARASMRLRAAQRPPDRVSSRAHRQQNAGSIDMLIRPLTPSDEPFLWNALYYAIHVPAGEATPARCGVEQGLW